MNLHTKLPTDKVDVGSGNEQGHFTRHLEGGVHGGIPSYKFKCCTWRECKRKIFTTFFRTSEIIAQMGPTHPSSCWWNCGTHTHIFWLCPKLHLFWRVVFDALKEVFQPDIS